LTAKAAGRFRTGVVMVGSLVAEVWRVEMIFAAVQVGWAAWRMAAAPATKEAEALVPIAWTYRMWPRLKQPKLWPLAGRPSVVLVRPLLQAP